MDAFIICPAPGSNTLQMLQELNNEVPFVLITEDVYIAGEGKDSGNDAEYTASGFPVIKPDNYQMGYKLGEELVKNNGGALDGKKIGIYAGREKTEATVSQVKGVIDALSGTGCEIIWEYYYLEIRMCAVLLIIPKELIIYVQWTQMYLISLGRKRLTESMMAQRYMVLEAV